MNEARILLMFAGSYNIPAQNGDSATSGVSVEYFFWGENGETFNWKVPASGDQIGVRRSKANLDLALYQEKLVRVPGIYDGKFEMRIGADGKPVLQLRDVDYVSEVSITQQLYGGSADVKPADKAADKVAK